MDERHMNALKKKLARKGIEWLGQQELDIIVRNFRKEEIVIVKKNNKIGIILLGTEVFPETWDTKKTEELFWKE